MDRFFAVVVLGCVHVRLWGGLLLFFKSLFLCCHVAVDVDNVQS